VTNVPVIAIVDDHESFREALARFLGTFGFCVRIFASGEAFLQSGELGVVECLLLDLAMPGMSGLEVKQQLGVRGLRIPTVFVTAHADDEVKQHLLAAGAIAMLPKPVDSLLSNNSRARSNSAIGARASELSADADLGWVQNARV
jgi:FixJ family two-component response regulator